MTLSAQTNDPIEFCPAAACAAAIVRLEGFIDHVAGLYQFCTTLSQTKLGRRLATAPAREAVRVTR